MATTSERRADLTEEQRRAIETRGVSVSLSAGAGCGKTLVLTERYLAHFDPRDDEALQPDEIGQLVAITFTERAAREMRDRIRAKCYQRLEWATPEEAPYWAELLRALDNARISTIHSFCASLLRLRAVEAGVDPQFAVLEQAQAETLLTEAIDDRLRALIGERDETIVDLAVRFNLDELRRMVRQLAIQCTPDDFQRWGAMTPAEQMTRWAACLEKLPPALGIELASSPEAEAVWRVLRDNVPDNGVMRQRRAVLLETLESLRRGPPDVGVLVEHLLVVEEHARVQGGGTSNSWPTIEAYQTFQASATKLRASARKLATVVDFDPATAREAAVIGAQLLAVAAGAAGAYAVRKAELRVMDFDDLLVRTRKLLTDPGGRQLLERLRSRVTLLLVDEFQDTDPQQVQLVEALCGEGTARGKLFFVGDFKQSIYRFRGADPHVFRRLREQTPSEGRQSLSHNFRSQPGILHFVNALFWDDLGPDFEPLQARRAPLNSQAAVEFIWATPAPGDNPKEKVDVLRAREADWIARRLRAMLDGGERIVADAQAHGSQRPVARAVRPGDIAILLRALTNVEAYEAALRRYGIDYYLVGGHAFYAQQEIFDLLNLLRTINSPADVVSLIGALRSGYFSLADETIFWLAQHHGGVAMGLFAETYPEEIVEDQQQRVAFAARTITRLRACKDRLRVCELIELAFSLTGYDAALLGEFLGQRKLANLLKLQEQARAFQRGDFLGLTDFIAQLSEFVVNQPHEALAATHSEDTDVVRLMSVHQAKGLEFPVVVVADVDRKLHDNPGRAQFDAELGPLVRLRDRSDEPIPSGFELWRHLERAEEIAELNRLFYVATTRAADYLILSAGVNSVGQANGPWTQLLARRFDPGSGRFLERLPETEPLPVVRVTTRCPPIRQRKGVRTAQVDIEVVISGARRARVERLPTAPPAIAAIPPNAAARRQYSFSRLAGANDRKFERLDEAEFVGSTTHDPRGLGTLVHAALAAIDLAAPGDWRQLVERLAEQYLPDAAQEVCEAVDMIERFVTSRRARRIVAAKVSHAEVEFLLGWPTDGPHPGDVVLRGFIDRLYQDPDGDWHVLDFKTNQVSDADVSGQSAAYEMQMLVYGLAAERILGRAPASLTLHFLRNGAEHAFDWDDAARQKVVALVNDGIAADRQEQSLQDNSAEQL